MCFRGLVLPSIVCKFIYMLCIFLGMCVKLSSGNRGVYSPDKSFGNIFGPLNWLLGRWKFLENKAVSYNKNTT